MNLGRDIERDKTTRWLKVVFTEEEWAEHASNLALRIKELDRARLEKSAEAKRWTDKIGGLSSEVNRLRGYVEDRSKLDEVECTIEKDYISNEYRVRRNDTGEVIETRVLTPDEKQQGLDL